MSEKARVRIDSHRLMQGTDINDMDTRVDSAREEIEKHKTKKIAQWKKRARIHLGIFSVSFIFTLGVFTLGILMWVKPDELFALVMVSLFSAVVFVLCFAWLRVFILHKVLKEHENKEDDPGIEHHVAKSITYAFVALVFAIMLGGLIIKIAQAHVY